MGEHTVDSHAPHMLPALPALDHRLPADPLDKIIAHGGKRGIPVHPAVLLHLHNAVLHQIQFVFGQRQSVYDLRVPFHDLRRRETGRHTDPLRMVLHLMADRMDTAVHRAFLAEIRHFRVNAPRRHLPDRPDQILDAFVFRRADCHHRHTKRLLHLSDIYGTTVAPHLVHHIERDHHGNM